MDQTELVDANNKNSEIKNNSEQTGTELKYLYDTFKLENESKIVGFDKDSKGSFLILDETIFYPQGGGQPADNGTIQIDEHVLNINFVGFNNGIVNHYYTNENIPIENLIGKKAILKVDSDRRLNHAKSHTSGHLLGCVVESLASELIAIKGHHFPDGPYVEFKGKLASLSADDLQRKVNEILKEKINAKLNVSAMEIDPIELKNQRNTEFQLQPGNKTRLVQIETFEPVPCGGTHLSSLSDLKEVLIRKIQFPKGNTKISYTYA